MGGGTSTARQHTEADGKGSSLAAAAAPLPGRRSSQAALPASTKERRRSKITVPASLSPHSAAGVIAEILGDRNERKLFESYLEGEYCPEILRFYKSVEAYARAATKLARVRAVDDDDDDVQAIALGHGPLVAKARSVYEKFLAPGCPEPVNVSAKCAMQIAAALDTNRVAPNLFKAASAQLLKILLHGDKFKQYAKWVESDAALDRVLVNFHRDGETGELRRKSCSSFDTDCLSSEFSDDEPQSPTTPSGSKAFCPGGSPAGSGGLGSVAEIAGGGGRAEAAAALKKGPYVSFNSPPAIDRRPSLKVEDQRDVVALRERIASTFASDVVSTTISRHVASAAKIETSEGSLPRLARMSDPLITTDLVRRKSSYLHDDDADSLASSSNKSRKFSVTAEDL